MTAAGYVLLQWIRSYSVLDMYAALEVHTEETIAAGQSALLKFENLLKVFSLFYCTLHCAYA